MTRLRKPGPSHAAAPSSLPEAKIGLRFGWRGYNKSSQGEKDQTSAQGYSEGVREQRGSARAGLHKKGSTVRDSGSHNKEER